MKPDVENDCQDDTARLVWDGSGHLRDEYGIGRMCPRPAEGRAPMWRRSRAAAETSRLRCGQKTIAVTRAAPWDDYGHFRPRTRPFRACSSPPKAPPNMRRWTLCRSRRRVAATARKACAPDRITPIGTLRHIRSNQPNSFGRVRCSRGISRTASVDVESARLNCKASLSPYKAASRSRIVLRPSPPVSGTKPAPLSVIVKRSRPLSTSLRMLIAPSALGGVKPRAIA